MEPEPPLILLYAPPDTANMVWLMPDRSVYIPRDRRATLARFEHATTLLLYGFTATPEGDETHG